MNLAELTPEPQKPSFPQFVGEALSGIAKGYTTDVTAFLFLTGVALNATNNENVQRVGKGLIGYSVLLQTGQYVGVISSKLQFIGGVIRDNPYFFEKHMEIQAKNATTETENE